MCPRVCLPSCLTFQKSANREHQSRPGSADAMAAAAWCPRSGRGAGVSMALLSWSNDDGCCGVAVVIGVRTGTRAVGGVNA